MKNKSQWYEQKRNELIGLLNETSTLKIPEKYAQELAASAKKCLENSFDIALIGEFQGGKSTTFNALCDGRDISPRGLGGGGIKTSAAAISAQNIADNETKEGLSEWAEVTFKTPYALALGMHGILGVKLADNSNFRALFPDMKDDDFRNVCNIPESFATLFNIEDDRHLQFAKEAIAGTWREWEQDRAKFSEDELDQLRISTLVTRFYGTSGYKKMIQKTVLPIDKFQNLVAFPKDWAIRWGDGADASFNIEEISFVFLDSVLVRLHSENLERIGCRITDCPGLFANAYDTNVAMKTIHASDGIWYLINGEKQIGEKDLKIIKTINNMGMKDKINATCNLKGPHEQKINEVMPVTKQTLQNAGYSVELFPYNARLAFLATQGKLILEHPEKFSEKDKECMIVDAKPKAGTEPDPKKMWVKMVNRLGGSTELENLEDISLLDEDSVAEVRNASYLDDILGRLEHDVIEKKAKSILIDNGSKRAAGALLQYEGDLEAIEIAAKQHEDEALAKLDEAKKELDDFIAEINKRLKRSPFVADKRVYAQQIANEMVQLLFEGDELTKGFAADVALLLAVKIVRKDYHSKEEFTRLIKDFITPYFAQRYKEATIKALGKWKNSNDGTFQNMKHQVENFCNDIQTLWRDRKMDSNIFLQNLDFTALDDAKIMEFVTANISDKVFAKDTDLSKIAEDSRYGFGSVVLKYIVSFVGAFLPTFIAMVLFGPAGWFVAAAAWLGKYIYDRTRSDEEVQRKYEEKVNKVFDKLYPDILKTMLDFFNSYERRQEFAKPYEDFFSEIQVDLANNIQESLEKIAADFNEERYIPAQIEARKSQEEKDRVAAENNRIRTTEIEPLRKKIQEFEKRATAEL